MTEYDEQTSTKISRIVAVGHTIYQEATDHWSTVPVVFECDDDTTVKTVVDYFRKATRNNYPEGIMIAFAASKL